MSIENLMVSSESTLKSTNSSVVYYKSVIGNATYSEITSIAEGLFRGFIVYLINRLLQAPPATFGVANEMLDIALEEVPASIREELQGTFDDLEQDGFQFACSMQLRTVGPVLGYHMIFSHPDAEYWASVPYVRAETAGLSNTDLAVVSLAGNGDVISTTNLRQHLRGPDHIKVSHLTGESNRAVIEAHRARISQMEIETVRSAELRSLVRRVAASTTEYNINRGVFVPLTTEELEKIQRQQPA